MEDYRERIKKASEAVRNAEYILIGAGAGLSDAAGLKYSGKRFTDRFPDFIKKYRMEDLYTSSFYKFGTMEEKWAYWARHISLNRFETPATELYKKLYQLTKEKKYFMGVRGELGRTRKSAYAWRILRGIFYGAIGDITT
jgi:NAD-dependent SIR2 family protein deacetylase